MFKKLMLIPLVLVLAACDGDPNTSIPASEDISSQALSKTPGLEGCTLYKFKAKEFDRSLNIIKCDGKETVSTNQVQGSSKNPYQTTTIVVNGKKYSEVAE